MLQDNVKWKIKLELSQCSPWSGSRGVAPPILTLSTRSRLATSRTLRFTPVTEPQYMLNGRLGGPQNRSGRFGGDNIKICFKTNGAVLGCEWIHMTLCIVHRLFWRCWCTFGWHEIGGSLDSLSHCWLLWVISKPTSGILKVLNYLHGHRGRKACGKTAVREYLCCRNGEALYCQVASY
jgi:hypothetical protein